MTKRQSTRAKLLLREARAASEHNATSPLLQLSPELRNRIYERALGGNIIHARVVTKPHAHSKVVDSLSLLSAIPISNVATPLKDGTLMSFRLCQSDTDDQAHLENIQREPNLWDGALHASYDTRHAACYRSSQQVFPPHEGRPPSMAPIKRLDVSLLRVCTQIHAEAALLPFKLNAFQFPSLEALAMFPATDMPIQAKALRTATVCAHYGDQIHLEVKAHEALMGMRHLVALYETPLDPRARTIPFKNTVHCHTLDALLKLRHIPFSTLTLTAYLTPPSIHELRIMGRYGALVGEHDLGFSLAMRERCSVIESILLADYGVELAERQKKKSAKESAQREELELRRERRACAGSRLRPLV